MSRYRVQPFDTSRTHTYPLSSRPSKVSVESFGRPHKRGGTVAEFLSGLPQFHGARNLRYLALAIGKARAEGKPVLWGLGAHVIKTGLSPILIDLMDRGFVAGIALNGAGVIHDFEIATAGSTSEDVESQLERGDFGMAEETGLWNLVFIQFNANPDGSFSPLPAKHVDTGMGFERVTGIMQNTRNFTDFSRIISNYETDIFRPLFDKLEKLSGRKYGSTLPAQGSTCLTDQEKADIAFRVIADHIRTLSFAIADGIQPGNTDRSYVLRRILRRAVRYGRSLGFHGPFFYKLVNVLADSMGHVFPEVRARQEHIEEVIQREEQAIDRHGGWGHRPSGPGPQPGTGLPADGGAPL